MNNFHALTLATTALTRAAMLKIQLDSLPVDVQPLVGGAIDDLVTASEHYQREAGVTIQVEVARREIGANPVMGEKRTDSLTPKHIVEASTVGLGNVGQFGIAPPAKKKVMKTPGYGKTSQYVDVPEAFGTAEVSVWTGIVRESAQARAEKLGLSIKREWKTSFKAFLDDMGYKPHPQARMVRKDRAKGYTPRNMTWRVDGDDVAGLKRKPNGWGKKV